MKTMIGLWKNWKNVPMDVKLIETALALGAICAIVGIGLGIGLQAIGLDRIVSSVIGAGVMVLLIDAFLKELITKWLPTK